MLEMFPPDKAVDQAMSCPTSQCIGSPCNFWTPQVVGSGPNGREEVPVATVVSDRCDPTGYGVCSKNRATHLVEDPWLTKDYEANNPVKE